MILLCQPWFINRTVIAWHQCISGLLDSSSIPKLFLYQLLDQLLWSCVKGTVTVLRNRHHFVFWIRLPMEINELFIFSRWKIFLLKIVIKLTNSNFCRKFFPCTFCLKYILSYILSCLFLRDCCPDICKMSSHIAFMQWIKVLGKSCHTRCL